MLKFVMALLAIGVSGMLLPVGVYDHPLTVEGHEPSKTAPAVMVDEMAEPFTGASCGWCSSLECILGHDMKASGDRAYHDCLEIPCMSHPSCSDSLSRDEMVRLWSAYVGDDVNTLEAMVREYPAHLAVNPRRRSIQIEGCGVLMANLPLDTYEFAVLSE